MRLLIVGALFGMSVGYAVAEWQGLAVGLACAMGCELLRDFYRWADLL